MRSLDRVTGWVNFQHTGIWGEAAAQNLSNLRDKSGNHTRQRRQRDVLQALREGTTTPPPGVAQATQLFRATVDRSITSPDAAYRAYAERAIAESCRTFAQLHNSTTPEQRERAVRRLAAYERDARELATRP